MLKLIRKIIFIVVINKFFKERLIIDDLLLLLDLLVLRLFLGPDLRLLCLSLEGSNLGCGTLRLSSLLFLKIPIIDRRLRKC